MGADIHSYLEKRVNGVWVAQGEFEEEDNGDGSTYLHQPYRKGPYSGRNYWLFAILADVRNYTDHFTPWDVERGVPDDASAVYSHLVEQWDGDGHSHSWYTLPELIEHRRRTLLQGGDYLDATRDFFQQVFDFVEGCRDESTTDEDFRLVFFFDN